MPFITKPKTVTTPTAPVASPSTPKMAPIPEGGSRTSVTAKPIGGPGVPDNLRVPTIAATAGVVPQTGRRGAIQRRLLEPIVSGTPDEVTFGDTTPGTPPPTPGIDTGGLDEINDRTMFDLKREEIEADREEAKEKVRDALVARLAAQGITGPAAEKIIQEAMQELDNQAGQMINQINTEELGVLEDRNIVEVGQENELEILETQGQIEEHLAVVRGDNELEILETQGQIEEDLASVRGDIDKSIIELQAENSRQAVLATQRAENFYAQGQTGTLSPEEIAALPEADRIPYEAGAANIELQPILDDIDRERAIFDARITQLGGEENTILFGNALNALAREFGLPTTGTPLAPEGQPPADGVDENGLPIAVGPNGRNILTSADLALVSQIPTTELALILRGAADPTHINNSQYQDLATVAPTLNIDMGGKRDNGLRKVPATGTIVNVDGRLMVITRGRYRTTRRRDKDNFDIMDLSTGEQRTFNGTEHLKESFADDYQKWVDSL